MLKPERTHAPESGIVFFAMPFGQKSIADRDDCDFDTLYRSGFAPVVEACGMKPERLDDLYGPQGVLEIIWRAIQRAEIVVIDFSFRSANVSFEYGLAWSLGKRIIALTQHEDDIPIDIRGLNRYIRYSQYFADMERMKSELTLQLKALREEPSEERALIPYVDPGMTTVPAPAAVIAVDHDYALVQTDDGRLGALRGADVQYARIIPDMTRRFAVGDRLEGAFLVDTQRSEARYTLLAGQTDPWPALALRYPVGTRFHSTVLRVIDKLGLFVRIDGEVNGLIHQDSLPHPAPSIGDKVEVVVTRMDATKRQASLRLLTADPMNDLPVRRIKPLPKPGHQTYATVIRTITEHDGRGSFLLLRLPGLARPALLPAQYMSEDLLADLNNGRIDIGGKIFVEVVSVDIVEVKVLLRELPEADTFAAGA